MSARDVVWLIELDRDDARAADCDDRRMLERSSKHWFAADAKPLDKRVPFPDDFVGIERLERTRWVDERRLCRRLPRRG